MASAFGIEDETPVAPSAPAETDEAFGLEGLPGETRDALIEYQAGVDQKLAMSEAALTEARAIQARLQQPKDLQELANVVERAAFIDVQTAFPEVRTQQDFHLLVQRDPLPAQEFQQAYTTALQKAQAAAAMQMQANADMQQQQQSWHSSRPSMHKLWPLTSISSGKINIPSAPIRQSSVSTPSCYWRC